MEGAAPPGVQPDAAQGHAAQLLDEAIELFEPGSDIERKVALRFLLGTHEAGVVIGRKGSNRNEIQTVTQAKLRLSDPNEYWPGTSDRVLLIAGPIGNVVCALLLVFKKIQESGKHTSGPAQVASPSLSAGGSGSAAGSTSAYTQHAQTSEAGPSSGPIPSSSTPFGADQAGVPTASAGPSTSTGRSALPMGPAGPDSYTQVKLLLPAALAGIIIGPGGQTIQQISADCGVSISLSPQDHTRNVDYERVATVTGTRDTVLKAIIKIANRLLASNQSSAYFKRNLAIASFSTPVHLLTNTGSGVRQPPQTAVPPMSSLAGLSLSGNPPAFMQPTVQHLNPLSGPSQLPAQLNASQAQSQQQQSNTYSMVGQQSSSTASFHGLSGNVPSMPVLEYNPLAQTNIVGLNNYPGGLAFVQQPMPSTSNYQSQSNISGLPLQMNLGGVGHPGLQQVLGGPSSSNAGGQGNLPLGLIMGQQAISVVTTPMVGMTDTAATRQVALSLPVPENAVGAVIGRAGSKLKQFKDMFGVKVVVADKSQTDPVTRTRNVYMSGQHDQVRQACTRMSLLVQDFMAKQGIIWAPPAPKPL